MLQRILVSSYEAMQLDCPKGHAKAGYACQAKYGKYKDTDLNRPIAAVVCPSRRALVRIHAPGRTVVADVR